MAAIHVLVDGGAALPLGAAVSYGLTQIAHHVQVGATRFHAGTADPADLNAALADPRMAVLPAEFAELGEGYGAAVAMGVAVLSLHAPTRLRGMGAQAAAAAAAAGLPPERLAVRVLPLLGPGLGMLALHAAEVAQDPIPLTELADAIADLAERMHSETVAMDPVRLLAKAAEAGLRVIDRSGAIGGEAGSPTPGADGPLSYRLEVAAAGGAHLVIVDRCSDLSTAMRQLAARVLADGRGKAVHLAAASAGAEPEVAALATFLDAQLGLAEAWLAPADPLSAWLGGAGSFTVAWYAEAGPPPDLPPLGGGA
ncbi:MAG: hypothetical protein IPJ58_05500 [Ardenticatenia bacterium]|nr:hypothetical protein [Ardenticatenia bacterium]